MARTQPTVAAKPRDAIPLADQDATSVDGFLQLVPISRAHFYNEVRLGRGPKLAKIGSRTLITRRARVEYLRASEREAAYAN